jgi:serine phosphatase RsbU (regulator of sigma subunit)
MYTDGLVERRNDTPERELFGEARLAEALKSFATRDVKDLVEGLMGQLEHFSKIQDDDVTVMAVRRT